MIILLGAPTAENIATYQVVATMYQEPLVRFTPDLDLAHAAPSECLSFCGHTYDDENGRVTHFGGSEDPLIAQKDASFFIGYTPEQFAEQLLEHGLTPSTQSIELWGCGVGDTNSDYPESYAKRLALALAEKGYFPTVRATSTVSIVHPLTHASVLALSHKPQSTEIMWHIRVMRAETQSSPKVADTQAQITYWCERVTEIGLEYIELRSRAMQSSTALDSGAPSHQQLIQQREEISKKLAKLSNPTEYYMTLLSDDTYQYIYDFFIQIDEAYQKLCQDIEEKSYKRVTITQLKKGIEKQMKQLQQTAEETQSDLTVETPLTQALAMLEQRITLYNQSIYLQQQITDMPLSTQEELSAVQEKFSEAQAKLTRYTDELDQYRQTLASFKDIRQYLQAHPENTFSVDQASYQSTRAAQQTTSSTGSTQHRRLP